MASITIRNLDDDLKQRLRVRAAERGHSMEQEVREILRVALAQTPQTGEELYRAIRARVEPIGGIELGELEMPPRGPMREPPQFD
ncbi:MAG: plasmid stabilization protein [Chloroflexi bacterium]|nr:plasmid stabilization protein [Chloroflexota bacterium]